MVSIAFYGGIPGGISTPITQQPEETSTEGKNNIIYQPYCYNKDNKGAMAEGRESRYKEDMNQKEDHEDGKRRNDWWKIGMFILCLAGATGGILWWYEGVTHPFYIGLVTIGGRLEESSLSNAIECWGKFPGCRPFTHYFSYETNRTVYAGNNSVSNSSVGNNSVTLLHAYQREITYIYKTSCVDSDHCQEYVCQKVKVNDTNNDLSITKSNGSDSFWKFSWLECNQTENAKTILVPEDEMMPIDNDTDTWIPKGCNETWAKVQQCPMDLLYGFHPIRLCVQPPFFLIKNNNNSNSNISNCGPLIRLGILKDNKAVVSNGSCQLKTYNINRKDYSGTYQEPIFYSCNFTVQPCSKNNVISVIMYENSNVHYLLCNNRSRDSHNGDYSCIVQNFGVIGQAHLQLPRPKRKISKPQFANYSCSINDKTELEKWRLVKTSGITPIPISSESSTGLIRYKRDFGISAIIAAIVAATAIAASVTMSYVALTNTETLMNVENHTFAVENNTINSVELLEKQIHILYAMILQTHADVQLLKEKQQTEEVFNLIGCVEQTHTFCHTGHPWNSTWGHLNDSTQWDNWVGQMERYNQDILKTLHAARNNLEQSMITFNTPDSIAQFGKNIWSHIANWIPGLGASIIKYIVMFLLIYLLLTSTPKILRALLTTISGAGSSASRYLKRRYHQRHVSREENSDQDRYKAHLVGVTVGSEDRYSKRKRSRNDWNGESEEYNKQRKSYETLIEAFGESYITPRIKEGITHPGSLIDSNKNINGENPHQGSLNLKIQSEGGSVYDCCIKAQEGTLAIPCCGFPLWLFWGLIIVLGRLLGYGLHGLAKILSLFGKGLSMLFEIIRKLFDNIGKALNPAKSHVSMPQYI
uniref:Envelope glycoprotein n=1 Tax=Equine infectious anemia virus TaxID=11665 RepID=A0A6B9PWT3_9RETR|nr:envelope glycoprotein [Equine infectious anemia virus]